jgi:hypothetical protein
MVEREREHIGLIWSRVTCLALLLAAAQSLEHQALEDSQSLRHLTIATEKIWTESIERWTGLGAAHRGPTLWAVQSFTGAWPVAALHAGALPRQFENGEGSPRVLSSGEVQRWGEQTGPTMAQCGSGRW